MIASGVLSGLQYTPGQSILHRIDPRAKFVFFVMYSVMLFNSASLASLLGYGLIVLGLLGCAKIHPLRIWHSIRGIVVLILLLNVVQIASHPGGNAVAGLFGASITSEGVDSAVRMTMRWLSFYFMAILLLATTSPTGQMEALRKLLSPLQRFGVRSELFVFMLTIAVLYVPYLIADIEQMLQARKARGVWPAVWNVPSWGKEIFRLLNPLIITVFRRADALSDALESRGYQPGCPRSEFEPLKFGVKDTGFVFAALLLPLIQLIPN